MPAPADVDPQASMTAVSDDDRVVVLLDGLLSAWDRPSRQQIGEPATIGEGPDEQRALRRGHAWLRPGRPDQVVITAAGQPVLIYSLAERRIVARLPVPSATSEAVVDPTGSRLAVRTGTSTAARSAARSGSVGGSRTRATRPTRCFLAGSDSMPGRLPLTAQVWADRLCAVVGPYTEAEVRALPDGAQDRHPCP